MNTVNLDKFLTRVRKPSKNDLHHSGPAITFQFSCCPGACASPANCSRVDRPRGVQGGPDTWDLRVSVSGHFYAPDDERRRHRRAPSSRRGRVMGTCSPPRPCPPPLLPDHLYNVSTWLRVTSTSLYIRRLHYCILIDTGRSLQRGNLSVISIRSSSLWDDAADKYSEERNSIPGAAIAICLCSCGGIRFLKSSNYCRSDVAIRRTPLALSGSFLCVPILKGSLF